MSNIAVVVERVVVDSEPESFDTNGVAYDFNSA